MLKSKNQRIKELQEENKQLKEENAILREGACRCIKPPLKEEEVAKIDTSVIPPAKVEGNVISQTDFLNL